MLSWDDQAKPALQTAMPTFNNAGTAPAAGHSSPSASAAASSERRVNVADKRIINGQTDVKFCGVDDPTCEACQ